MGDPPPPPADPAPAPSPPPAPPLRSVTPWPWRAALGAAVLTVGLAAYALQDVIGPRGQSAAGVVCILAFVAVLSVDLRAVNWRTVGWGVVLQALLALFILRFEINGLEAAGIPDGFRPGYELFHAVGDAVKSFLAFTARGSEFVFGALARPADGDRAFGPGRGFIFAFNALPTIIFASSFFTILYYLGVLQWLVRVFARAMATLMQTSGAESLCVTANVFLGQTEAPLMVRPYVPRMTQSELFTLMVGGFAHISGGLMAVYIGMGADQVAILATSVMAAPASLYLSKLLLPEREQPETRGVLTASPPPPHANVVDAAAGGASDGLFLALNVAAMLIAFLALLQMVDYLLGLAPAGRHLHEWLTADGPWALLGRLLLTAAGYAVVALLARRAWGGPSFGRAGRIAAHLLGYAAFLAVLAAALPALPEGLSMRLIFSRLFAPLAFLMGVQGDEVFALADLLGTKLALNEFVAYAELRDRYAGQLSPRAVTLATYALTGFANFGSIGIQLGGIGAMAPARRPDLARLGGRALLVGFLATILNAAVAGLLMPDAPPAGPGGPP